MRPVHTFRFAPGAATAAAFFALLLPGACTVQGESSPDLILKNGEIFTADSLRSRAEALAIDAGRIVAVGSDVEVERLTGVGTRVIDLGGRLVVPGLVDAHQHVTYLGPEGVALAFENPDPSWETVRSAIRVAAADSDDRNWILGTIGPAVLFDPRANRTSLDTLAPDTPVRLAVFTGHGWLMNSAGLRAIGVTDDTRDPPGGWYGRDEGRLDGWLWEYAQWRQALLAGGPTLERGVAAVEEYVEAAAAWGVTAVHEVGGSYPLARHLEVLATAEPPLRWTVYHFAIPEDSVGDALSTRMPPPAELASRVDVAGMKWVLDGTPVEGNVLTRRPSPRRGTHGRMNFAPRDLRLILRNALTTPHQLALHVAGDSTLALVLSIMEDLAPADEWRSRRVRIEHGDGLGGNLLARVAHLGIVLVQNPLHFAGGPLPGFPQSLRSAVEAGVPLALGADAGGEEANPWLNLMLATTHPARPDEALSREEALFAYTRGGAYAAFAEGERGSLTPGKLADLAVLDRNVLKIEAEELPGTRSVMTLVNGEIIHETGVLVQEARR